MCIFFSFFSMASDVASAAQAAAAVAASSSAISRSSTASRDPSVGDHQLQSKAYLSPSDTSIDESVKSAQAGKDVSILVKKFINFMWFPFFL